MDSTEEHYVSMRFFIGKDNATAWTEDEIDDYMEAFLDFMDAKDLHCGGSLGRLSEKEECPYCNKQDIKTFIKEEDRCDSCGGSGHKTEEESTPEKVASWNDTYAPVAQRTEQLFPKQQVEDSISSRRTIIEEKEE